MDSCPATVICCSRGCKSSSINITKPQKDKNLPELRDFFFPKIQDFHPSELLICCFVCFSDFYLFIYWGLSLALLIFLFLDTFINRNSHIGLSIPLVRKFDSACLRRALWKPNLSAGVPVRGKEGSQRKGSTWCPEPHPKHQSEGSEWEQKMTPKTCCYSSATQSITQKDRYCWLLI